MFSSLHKQIWRLILFAEISFQVTFIFFVLFLFLLLFMLLSIVVFFAVALLQLISPLASGARIFIEHAAYFLTDIEAVVVKNTHTYRMIVNLTKFKRKKEMKCERLLLDSKVQNIKEKRRKSL